MKGKVYLSLLACAGMLGLAACSSEEEFEQQGGETATTITVKVPGSFSATRAGAIYTNSGVSGYQNLGSTGTVYLAMYPENGEGEATWSGEAPIVNGEATFSPKGFKGTKVKYVGYATVGEKKLGSADLKTIDVSNTLNDESLDCFSGAVDGTFGTTTELTLRRPNCKVRLVCDDWADAKKWVKEVKSVEVTTTDGSLLPFGKLNAMTSTYSEDNTLASLTSTEIPTYTGDGDSQHTLMVDYIPVNADEIVNTSADIKVTFTDLNGAEQTKTLHCTGDYALPVKRNRLITVMMNFLDESEFTVKVDDDFDSEVTVPVTTAEELDNALKAGAKHIQLGADITTADRISFTAGEQSLDLNGHTLTCTSSQTAIILDTTSPVTISNGRINSNNLGSDEKGRPNVQIEQHANTDLTIENCNLTANNPVFHVGHMDANTAQYDSYKDNKLTIKNSTITSTGNVGIIVYNSGNVVTLNNSTINHGWFGIQQQGTKLPGSTFILKNSNITGPYSGIYLSSNANATRNTLDIDGGTITSEQESAIEVKKTDITVKNATLVSKATAQSYSVSVGGSNALGYGIALVGYQVGTAYEGTTSFENNTFQLAAGADAVKIGKYNGTELEKVE